ncbi:MAG: hypothetical protein A3E78_01965 [Alphaproteobacteria bacterium RIFCSPHIGHO2_12_FULL_63_12]|nr:MAG: hypothetical protein A3E78_01965 [Alphaproteobacteria bacterium RIFCSPHIGHO2_12_FULL_63_12]
MALSGNDRAILTARVGVARVAAFRVGFAPVDTQGLTPGSAGGFYIWSQVTMPTTTWTAVKR